jgi:EAL domain-containing protein (putative c-di-GMP-specific phosphodiesterase class I)
MADLAMYAAKRGGKNRRHLFSPSLRAAAAELRRHSQDLRRAVEEEEFELHYQPQVDLADRSLVGAEALMRWNKPGQGLLSPAAFLSAVEESRYVVEVGDWVLRTACRQAAAWHCEASGRFRMGVNTFGAQFRGRDFAAVVMRGIDDVGLAPEALEIEVTENIVLRKDDGVVGSLTELRRQGVSIAFDDYGTGFASLSLLKAYPLSRLKIDRSFVAEMTTVADVALIRAILHLASAFRLDVIAEGIETEDQVARLLRKGCKEGQGYLFGKPMSARMFEAEWRLGVPQTLTA